MMKAGDYGVVFSHFVACFIGLGTIYTFGYWMPAILAEFKSSDAQTQVVTGCMQTGWSLGGLAARSFLKMYGFRMTYAAGAIMAVVALIAVSFAPVLPVTYLVFFVGMGLQATWLSSASLIPRHLSQTDAARFSAFAVTGSGFGTLTFANLARVLEPALGWRWSFRVFAAVFAVLLSIGAALQKPPPPLPQGNSSKGGFRILFSNFNFSLVAFACAFSSFGYMLPFLVQGAHAERLGVSADNAATVYMLFGIFSIIGRVGAGVLAGWVNPLHVWTCALFLITAAVAVIGCATEAIGLAVGNVCLGIFSGPMIALLVPAMRELVSVSQIPEALVIVMLSQTATALPGPVFAGWLADMTGSYRPGILTGAASIFAAGIIVLGVVVRIRLQEKVESQKTVSSGGSLEESKQEDAKTVAGADIPSSLAEVTMPEVCDVEQGCDVEQVKLERDLSSV